MTDVRRDSGRTNVCAGPGRMDVREGARRTDIRVDAKPGLAERLLVHGGLLLMAACAIYTALHMGWIRTSLFY